MACVRTNIHRLTANKSPIIEFEVPYFNIIRLTLAKPRIPSALKYITCKIQTGGCSKVKI